MTIPVLMINDVVVVPKAGLSFFLLTDSSSLESYSRQTNG